MWCRFLAALEDAGAEAVRVNAYATRLGSAASDCAVECALLENGHIDAIAFSSTAEVTRGRNKVGLNVCMHHCWCCRFRGRSCQEWPSCSAC
jgi:hypothetical protein